MTEGTINYPVKPLDLTDHQFVIIDGVEYKLIPHPDYVHSYDATPVLEIELEEK